MSLVLIVDDEFDVAGALSAVLECDGWDVHTCAHGGEALEYLARHSPPALVLLDVMMPFVNGYDVLREMRSKPPLEAVPVILMSAAAPAEDQKALGWSSFLAKPFNIDSLLKEVARLAGTPQRD